MRLHAGPGRGGRGLPWLAKPKYLSQQHNTLENTYVDPNNFYEVLETIEEKRMTTMQITNVSEALNFSTRGGAYFRTIQSLVN